MLTYLKVFFLLIYSTFAFSTNFCELPFDAYKNKLASWEQLSSECPDLSNALELYYPKDVYLVFASYDAAQAASLFGHTFFRFSKEDSQGQEFQDYAVTYGATVQEGDGPLAYTWKGLTGGYLGQWQFIPYIYKVQEYSWREGRNLWSWKLLLTEDEKRALVLALWQSSKHLRPYYYVSDHCAISQWDLLASVTSRMIPRKPREIYLPVDLLKAVSESRLISQESVRYSRSKIFDSMRNQLSRSDYKTMKECIYHKNECSSLSVKALDAALEYYNIEINSSWLESEKKSLREHKYALLLLRSKFQEELNAPVQKVNPLDSPVKMHPRRKLYMSYSALNDKSFSLGFRPLFHAPTDDSSGLNSQLLLSMMETEVSYDLDEKKIALTELKLLHLGSWTDAGTAGTPFPSYELYLGVRNQYREGDWHAGPSASLALGKSLVFEKTYMALMLKTRLEEQWKNHKGVVQLGPEFLWQWDISQDLHLRLVPSYLWDMQGRRSWEQHVAISWNFFNNQTLEWDMQFISSYEKATLTYAYLF